jgi:hypothetical protein
MTLRAMFITMRGRIREALCPDIQVLRYENELLRRALSAQYDIARDVGANAYQRGYTEGLNDCLRNGLEWAHEWFTTSPLGEKERNDE